MKKKFAIFAALTALTAATPALADSDVCIKSAMLDRTTVVNPKTILFHLKGGKTYRSELRTPCLGLKFNGFVYVTPTDEICGGSQSIRVLNTDQVCLLGKFTPEKIGQHS
jgi:hypothetical protein